MSSAAQAQPTQQPIKAPETVGQLVSILFQETLRALKRRIPLAIGMLLLGLIIHTFLLVGPNGGFWRAPNLLGDWLSARQNTLGGILLWTLLPALAVSNVQRARRLGSSAYFASFSDGLAWARESFAQQKDNGLPLLGLGALLALAVVTLLRNNLLSLVLAGCMVSALASRAESFWFLLTRLTWNDYQRFQNKGTDSKKPFSLPIAAVLTAGAAIGFTLGFILPGVRQYGLYMFFGLLILSAVILAVYLSRSKGQQPPAMLLLVFFLALMILTSMALPVFADDGGWSEAGGTFSNWIRSEGALVAVWRGLFPSLALVFGTAAGAVISLWSTLTLANMGLIDVNEGMARLANDIQEMQDALGKDDESVEIDDCAQARAAYEAARKFRKEAEDKMDEAYEEAQAAYDELKSTKGTENLQELEEAVNWAYEEALTHGSLKFIIEPSINVSFDTAKELLPDEKGAIAAGYLLKFAIAAFYAWNIGYEGAKAATLIYRSLKTNLLTFGKLLPARIQYDLACKAEDKAKKRYEELCF